MHVLTAETSHGDISFADGGGLGPVVLLIHGNSGSKRIFEKQFASELSAAYRLIAVDLPGHGDSSRAPDPEATYFIAGYASALIELLEAIGVDAFHVAGWSLGGHIALELLARVEGCKSAFVFGTPPIPNDPARAISAFLPSEHMELVSAPEFTEDQARTFVTDWFGDAALVEQWMVDDALRCDGRTRAIGFEKALGGANLDEEIIVRDVGKPLAVVHGQNDAFINLSFMQQLEYANLWRGAVQVIPGVGHTPQWEVPDYFNHLIDSFLTEAGANLTGL